MRYDPRRSSKKMMPLAVGGSLAITALLWGGLALGARFMPSKKELPTIELERVERQKEQQKEQEKPKTAEKQQKKAAAPQQKLAAKAPQPHFNLMTSAPGPADGNGGGEPAVVSGGNAKPGTLDDGAKTKTNTDVTPTDTHKTEPTPPVTTPPVTTTKKEPAKTPAPVAQPSRAVGETHDAQVVDKVLPSIPDDLRNDDGKFAVSVRVDVTADGAATPTLRTTSGNPEVDRLALEALKKWKWSPAMLDGQAVESTVLFKFEFEVSG